MDHTRNTTRPRHRQLKTNMITLNSARASILVPTPACCGIKLSLKRPATSASCVDPFHQAIPRTTVTKPSVASLGVLVYTARKIHSHPFLTLIDRERTALDYGSGSDEYRLSLMAPFQATHCPRVARYPSLARRECHFVSSLIQGTSKTLASCAKNSQAEVRFVGSCGL